MNRRRSPGARKRPVSTRSRLPVCFAVMGLFCMTFSAVTAVQGQTETVLYNFCSLGGVCVDGATPLSPLTPDGAGNFYGTTLNAGSRFGSYGNVFELSPNGRGGWTETSIYSFTGGLDGAHPEFSPVVFDTVGNLYGTTLEGGELGYGVVFELSPVKGGWTQTTLYSFINGADGGYPLSGVIMDRAGNLYGTTFSGGSGNFGTVFELSLSDQAWTEQTIYSFSASSSYQPSRLAMDAGGNLFGAAGLSVFELSPNGGGTWTPTTIHTFFGSFFGLDGTPVVDSAGNIFGTIMHENDTKKYLAEVYALSRENGAWKMDILQSWKNGVGPGAGVVLDTFGNIYGTTLASGTSGDGTVFELVHVSGKGYQQKVLWSFNGTDGAAPFATLFRDSSGNLYGTTAQGGTIGAGTIFEVTP
jgi:uncharacterized repeat protein (TIGR03803 family)